MGVLKFGDYAFNISTLDVDPKFLYDSDNNTYRIVIGDICTPSLYTDIFNALDKKSEQDFINDVTLFDDTLVVQARLAFIMRNELQYELEVAPEDIQFTTKESYDTGRTKDATKGKKGKRKRSITNKSTRK